MALLYLLVTTYMLMVDLPILSQRASVTLLYIVYTIAWHVEKSRTIEKAKRRTCMEFRQFKIKIQLNIECFLAITQKADRNGLNRENPGIGYEHLLHFSLTAARRKQCELMLT